MCWKITQTWPKCEPLVSLSDKFNVSGCVRKFGPSLNKKITVNIRWKRINVLGGKNGSREYSKGNKTVPGKVATTHTEDGHK